MLQLKKPLSCRLFPVPGKTGGDVTTFVNPHLCNGPVFSLGAPVLFPAPSFASLALPPPDGTIAILTMGVEHVLGVLALQAENNWANLTPEEAKQGFLCVLALVSVVAHRLPLIIATRTLRYSCTVEF